MSLRHDCQGRQIFCRSCLSCLTLFCRNKLSWCQQCAQTDCKTVRTIMASSFPSIPAATTPIRLVSLQTIAYVQALGIHSLSYMMHLKPLAAKASVFNSNFGDDVASSVAREPDFTEDRFYNDFSNLNCWTTSMATSCHRGLGGCIWASFGQPCRRRISKGDEFNKAAPAQPAPAAPAPLQRQQLG